MYKPCFNSGLWVIPLEPFGLPSAARKFSRRVYVGVIFNLDADVTKNQICFFSIFNRCASIQVTQPQRAFSWEVFREPLTPFF